MSDLKHIDQLKQSIEALTIDNANLKAKLNQAKSFCISREQKNIEYIYHIGRFKENAFSKIGKFIEKYLELFDRKKQATADVVISDTVSNYRKWIESYDRLCEAEHQNIERHIELLTLCPTFTIILDANNTHQGALDNTFCAMSSQKYSEWELIIIGDNNFIKDFYLNSPMREALVSKIKLVETMSSELNKSNLLKITESISGDFVAHMSAGDTLSEEALYEFAAEVDLYKDTRCLYSDEDVVDTNGIRQAPCFKPDWNLTLYLEQNYVGGLTFIGKKEFICALSAAGHAENLEAVYFNAFITSQPCQIRHISSPLFHRFAIGGNIHNLDWLRRSSELVKEYFTSKQETVEVLPQLSYPDWLKIRYNLPSPQPLVSILIPTRNRPDLLGVCLLGVFEKTNYKNVQVIIIDHENDHPEVLKIFSRYKNDLRFDVIPYSGEFDHSLMNNLAAQKARGEILLFLNDDIEIIDSDWLIEIVSRLSQQDCGVVGAKLIYPNRKIQHAGVILGYGGVAGHGHVGCELSDPGYFGRLLVASEVSALTGACMAMRRELFEKVGGFSARHLQRTFNDVDLCLKALAEGKKNIFTPFAVLIHHESATDGGDIKLKNYQRLQNEVAYMYRTWGLLRDDQYYNVNLSLDGKSFELAFPPRRTRPWQLIFEINVSTERSKTLHTSGNLN